MGRPKKVVTEKKKEEVVAKKTFTREEVEAGLSVLHQEFFMNLLALLSHLPDQKELSYSKMPLTTPDGGNYVVCALHIDGPKIDLQALGKAADQAVAEGKQSPSAEAPKNP